MFVKYLTVIKIMEEKKHQISVVNNNVSLNLNINTETHTIYPFGDQLPFLFKLMRLKYLMLCSELK